MATAISYEAGNEPEAGQEAVAQVVLNRLREAGYPKTVCEVVYEGSTRRTGCQFSFTCDGSLERWRPTRSLANARRIAALALAGQISSPIGAATHYHAYYVQPAWAARLTRVARIGAHIFYATAAELGRAPAGAPAPAPTVAPAESSPPPTLWGLQAAVLAGAAPASAR